MPTHKDLKRLIRRRMQKTSESYTAARAQLLKSAPASPAPVPPAGPIDYAKLAGMSDAAVKAATGCTWKKWVDALDYARADEWSHRLIAQYVREKFEVTFWWAQTVTVGYERIRGLREIGQRRNGGYETNKSRTFSAPISALFDAFAKPRRRARWLPSLPLTVRTSAPNRSLRFTCADGASVECTAPSNCAPAANHPVQPNPPPRAVFALRRLKTAGPAPQAPGTTLAGASRRSFRRKSAGCRRTMTSIPRPKGPRPCRGSMPSESRYLPACCSPCPPPPGFRRSTS